MIRRPDTPPPYEWLGFDADGVIFDYEQAERTALSEALRTVGQALDPDLLALYRQVNQELWQAWEQGRIHADALKTVRFERFLQRAGIAACPVTFGQIYLTALSRASHLWPGSRPVLKALKTRYRLALLTNGLRSVQRSRLARAALMGHFAVVAISEEIGVAKPARGFFEAALQRMGRPRPERVLVVGDSWEADIVGAATCGLQLCWFNPAGLPVPAAPPVQAVVRSWAELGRWLLGDASGSGRRVPA